MRGLLCAIAVIVVGGCNASVSGDPFDTNGGGDPLESSKSSDDSGPSTDANGPVAGDGGGDATSPPPSSGDDMPGPPHADADSPVPGAFWDNVTSNLAAITDSECGNAANIFVSPWHDMLITGVARRGLFASTDGGGTWSSLGGGGGSVVRHRMSAIVFDPAHPDTWWESGIYGWENPFSEGVFLTTDDGDSFTGFANMGPQKQSHNDSVSVDLADPLRKTILSGGHEQGTTETPTQGLFLSTDGGAHFDDIMARLPSGLGFCTSTLVVNASVLLVGCANSWKGQTPAILRSSNGGTTWNIVSTSGGSGQPLRASDGAIYWSTNNSMMKSENDGATFTKVSADGQHTGELPPLELPDGRIVSVGERKVVVSEDGGATWKAVTDTIPFAPNGITYSPFRRAFFASHFDCTSTVPSDAHARFGWDYETN